MRSSDVTAGNTIYASDVNKLRDDAYASSWLLAHEQTSPDLTLKVEEGNINIWGRKIQVSSANSPSFTAPATNPRIDLLSIVGSFEETQLSQTSYDTEGQWLGGNYSGPSTGHRDGQTFNIASFTSNSTSTQYCISNITVRGKRESSSSGYLYVSLWNVSAGVPTTIIKEYQFAKSILSTSASVVTIPDIIFDDLEIGTDYAIVFRNSSGTTNNGVRFQYNSTSSYANGTRVTSTNSGSSWASTSGDMYISFDITMQGVTYTLTRTAGTESVTPVAPNLPSNSFPIAQIYNRVGQTSIKDIDDTTNGYILKDMRSFIELNTSPIQRIYTRQSIIIGLDSTTQFDITNPSGTTFRYTYDGTGSTPDISATSIPTGSVLDIQGQNFSSGNKGLFTVTSSGTNYFEITNASGVAETNKTIGTGYINKGYIWKKPDGIKYIKVQGVGGGGGGQSVVGDGVSQTTGAGGNGGAYGEKIIQASDLTDTPVIIGSGGINNKNGERSLFGSSIIFEGGLANGSATIANATGVDFEIKGMLGQLGYASNTTHLSGYGGGTPFAPITRGVSNGNVDGINATGYGAGGSGANRYNSGSNLGGTGSDGLIIVTEFY